MVLVSSTEPSPATAADTAQVIEQVRSQGSTFYWGMRVLPWRRRLAVFAVYAFCRAVDDVADGNEPQETKLARLARWRTAVADLYAGRPGDPITRVLATHCHRFKLPEAEFYNIIAGMETDALGGLTAPTCEDFATYCRRVAGAVGVLSMQIFADGDTAATPERRLAVAEHLGEALQITNILRDRLEDAADGRLYLPAELLDAAGIAVRTPHAVINHPNCGQVCQQLSQQAHANFQHVRPILKQLDHRTSRPCWIMMSAYETLLTRLERRGFPLNARVRLSGPEKARLALRHALISPLL